MSGLAILFLLFDGGIKLAMPAPVAQSFAKLGYPVSLAPGIGILELVCTLVYLIPRSAVLGGAITSHLRVGDPWFTHTLFPIYIGLLVWGGLFLREDRLRVLIPMRR
jgi:hypothetical protein